MGIWISCGIAALIAAASAYVAYLAYTVEGAGGGFWFFTAFALFFGAAAAGVAIGALGRRYPAFRPFAEKVVGKPEEPRVRFVPHWQMMTAIVVLLAVLAAAIVSALVGVLF
ncbi:MAG: hypothetical protein HY323_16180 [Betaproteobacteria bacterium]|nr:hypothetical protein [Betaproteobacteria bacterium]